MAIVSDWHLQVYQVADEIAKRFSVLTTNFPSDGIHGLERGVRLNVHAVDHTKST